MLSPSAVAGACEGMSFTVTFDAAFLLGAMMKWCERLLPTIVLGTNLMTRNKNVELILGVAIHDDVFLQHETTSIL